MSTTPDEMMTPLESACMNNTMGNQLVFLERELYPYEVEECEKAAREYIKNDAFEIEIHNLNEVNEYFRIFKDDIVRRELTYEEELASLRNQIGFLRSKLDSVD